MPAKALMNELESDDPLEITDYAENKTRIPL